MDKNTNISTNIDDNVEEIQKILKINENFDLICRKIEIGGKKSALYLVDGFCKDDLMQKIMQYFYSITEEKMPSNAEEMSLKSIPYVEVDLERRMSKITNAILSGMLVLFIDGFSDALLIDARTYPARNVDEPEKDKSMRGSKDGFVETIVFNTALIRRRIRNPKLNMEMFSIGTSSKTDVVMCYMSERADDDFVNKIRERLKNVDVDALAMNQQSLSECIYKGNWFNPFPKFKYTERPDTASAQILEGSVILLVDNSPLCMILPTTAFDVMEEADDYYFPPITGTYLRLSRYVIFFAMFLVTPTFLLMMNHPEWIPKGLEFINVKEDINIPLIWQFIVLEIALDGLRLAAVNTPSMLSTPLSVMAALILGEFSVNSGWFNAEVMLYMAFVAIANYTQPNYEMGYALKFIRMCALVLTQVFGVYGYAAGILLWILCLVFNKTVSGIGYLYPLIPFRFKKLVRELLRVRIR